MRKVGTVIASVSRNAGGLFDSVRNLTFAVVDQGRFDNLVFGMTDRHTPVDLGAWEPLEVKTFDVVGPAEFGFAPGLYGAVCATGLDIIHNHGIWMYPSVAVRRCAVKRRIPYLVSPHGMLDPWAVANSRCKKLVAGALYERAHLDGAACIRALCAAEAQAIRAFGLRNPVCVIPNGVDLPERAAAGMPDWHSAMPSGRKVLLYLGRIHPKKGLVNLLHAWRHLRREAATGFDDWQIVVAGWDQLGHEHELKRLARDLGISDCITFTGPRFDAAKAATFSHADAFILPSVSEGLPMVVLEAWSFGLPVVMTPQCNLPEGVHARAALQVDPEIHSIAEGVRTLLLMNTEERLEMGSKGRDLVARRFSWDRIGSEMARVYDWVLGDGPKPDSLWR